jgi:XTP/dITP diphosphohydrolase
MKLIVATHNRGKAVEIREMLAGLNIEPLSLEEVGYHDEIIEDGHTYFANSMKKARALQPRFPDNAILADDSGLEVFHLDNRPGIHSARYAGPKPVQGAMINKLLQEMHEVPANRRGARFVCVMVMLLPDGMVFTSRGECYGVIGTTPRGANGFGFDPVFLPVEFQFQHTLAELPLDIKNQISHRSRALSGVKDMLSELPIFYGKS